MHTMTTMTNQQWRLIHRPEDALGPEHFTWHTEPVPPLQEGEFLSRIVYLSLDPTNRLWAREADSYLPPVPLGDVMRGVTLAVVEQSRHPRFQPGELVMGMQGWQSYAISDGTDMQKVLPIPTLPLHAYMGLFSHIGITAYVGLLDIGKPKAGETLVVSAAAGAVGSLVAQIGKIKGCRVVGIAGSAEKCRWLTDELGLDAAINYKTDDVATALRQHCPDGIDIYFDNVGGAILDAVLGQVNMHARIPVCGLISTYNTTGPVAGPANFGNVLIKRVRMQGFIVMDHMHRIPEVAIRLGAWLVAGKLTYRIDMVDGLEQAPQAIQRLFAGTNQGKLVVRVSEEPTARQTYARITVSTAINLMHTGQRWLHLRIPNPGNHL